MTQPKWFNPPDDLSSGAASYWKAYAKRIYEFGYLKPESIESFKFLCRTLALIGAAEADINSNGATTINSAGVRRANPACKILLDAQKAARPLLRNFGFDA